MAAQSEVDRYLGSAHHNLSCTSCHPGTRPEKHAQVPATRKCLDCHGPNSTLAPGAPHAVELHPTTNPRAPHCEDCHGYHGIGRSDDPKSPTYWSNIPRLCARCHVNASMSGIAPQVGGYIESIHGRAAAASLGTTSKRPAVCTDCHAIHPSNRPAGNEIKPTRTQIPAVCGRCHPHEEKVYKGSVHGQAVARGIKDAPVCINCHGEHKILPPNQTGSTVSPLGVINTCGKCHQSEKFVHLYGIPGERVSSYRASYHGVANELGNIKVANCVSCHGWHNIQAPQAATSTINPANVASTCAKCHPGAGTRFPIGRVHLALHVNRDWPLFLLSLIYQIFVYATLLGFAIYVVLDLLARYRLYRRGVAETFEKALANLPAPPPEALVRMTFYERVEHYARMFSFILLALTGMVLVFPSSTYAHTVVMLCGGMNGRAIIHRLAAALLIGSSLTHVIWIASTRHGRETIRGLLPKMQDLDDAWATVLWLTGMREYGPCFGRYTFLEKFEYWALVWGTVVMTVTGLLLVFVNWSLANLPSWVLDASTIIHKWEAILAIGAIVIYHLYHVVWRPGVFPGNLCWITGKLKTTEYIRDHPLDYAEAVGWLPGRESQERTEESASSEDEKEKEEGD